MKRDQQPDALSAEIGRAITHRQTSRRKLAEAAGIGRVTLAQLEAGRGTVTALLKVLAALRYKFADQPAGLELGPWIVARRKDAELSQERLCTDAGISKPAVINVERGKGRVETLTAIMSALKMSARLVANTPRLELQPQSDEAVSVRPASPLIRTLLRGDCIGEMRTMQQGSIDLIVTSPPYNAGKEYEINVDIASYKEFARLWCSELPRLLTDNGALWLNLGFTKSGETTTVPLTYLYHPVLTELGLHLVQEVVWHYEGGLAYKRRFTHRTERWQWWVKNPKHYCFDLDEVRDLALNRTRDRRNHRLGKNPTDYWYFDRVSGGAAAGPEKTAHPAQFPVAMVERIIRACSRPGETVLDPFGGSGSTAVAAARTGRGFISIERDSHYHQIARDRVLAA